MGAPAILRCRAGRSLAGVVEVPGDKSISQRALILGALAHGVTEIRGFLAAADCLHTLDAVAALGVAVERAPDCLRIHGGPDRLRDPEQALYLGNSGTGMRLLMGALAGLGLTAVFDGDASLRRRPMERIAEPLRRMGAEIHTSAGGTAPVELRRARPMQGIEWDLPVASAQLKSAILLAALNAGGQTRIREPGPSRDHTERLLAAFGAHLVQEGPAIVIAGPQRLRATSVNIPGDLSSAAFLIVAAAITPGSDVVLRGVGVNPTRRGVLDVLLRMGADIELGGTRLGSGEPVADIHIRGRSTLEAVDICGTEVVRAIDEIPILCIAAACARGTTRIRDAGELRLKESDRLRAMTDGLRRLGVTVNDHGDGLDIRGCESVSGGTVDSFGDHRIAMAFAVAAQRAEGDILVREPQNIGTSFPAFIATMNRLGMRLQEEAG